MSVRDVEPVDNERTLEGLLELLDGMPATHVIDAKANYTYTRWRFSDPLGVWVDLRLMVGLPPGVLPPPPGAVPGAGPAVDVRTDDGEIRCALYRRAEEVLAKILEQGWKYLDRLPRIELSGRIIRLNDGTLQPQHECEIRVEVA